MLKTLLKLPIDTFNIIFRPRKHFSELDTTGGFTYPVIKTFFYAYLSIFIIHLSPTASKTLHPAEIYIPAISLIPGLFLSALFMSLISKICNGDDSIRSCAICISSLLVTLLFPPLSYLFFGGNPKIFQIAIFLSYAYEIYLGYLALTLTLNGNKTTAKIIATIFIILAFFSGPYTF
jgi:Yip1 domain